MKQFVKLGLYVLVNVLFTSFLLTSTVLSEARWLTTESGSQVQYNIMVKPQNLLIQWSGNYDKDNYATGQGVLKFSYNENVYLTYEGTMVRGQFEGEGVMRLDTDVLYKAPKKEVTDYSPGILALGSFTYTGNFADGRFHGKGVLNKADGFTYEGDFAQGEQTGKGILRWPSIPTRGETLYEGDFIKGKRTGKGTYKQSNGFSYTGDFVNDEFNGQGVLVLPNGSSFEGDFRNSRPHGHIKAVDPQGNIFEGEFVDGKAHGLGTLYSPDGKILKQGEWENGKFKE